MKGFECIFLLSVCSSTRDSEKPRGDGFDSQYWDTSDLATMNSKDKKKLVSNHENGKVIRSPSDLRDDVFD